MHRKLKHPIVDQTSIKVIKKSVNELKGSVNSPIKCEDCNVMVDTNETLHQHRLLHHTSLKTQGILKIIIFVGVKVVLICFCNYRISLWKM